MTQHTNIRKTPGKILRGSIAALVGVAFLAGATVTQAETKLIWGSPNPRGLNVGWSPFFLAKDKGYFAAEGINEVDLVTFNGTATLLPQVVSKAVMIGSPNPDIPIISQQPGRDTMPLTFFYNFMRASVWQVIVPADSPVKSLADLKGKTVGVGAMTWANIPTTKAMLKNAGLDTNKDVTLLAVGVGGPAYQAFNNGEVDALNLYDTAHAQLELSGTKIRRLPLPDEYTGLFSTGFITHADTIKNSPEVLTGFGRALTKGIVACFANPEACVKAYYNNNPAKKPKPEDEAKAVAKSVAILKARGASYLAFADDKNAMFGSYPDNAFSNYIKVLHAQGGLETQDIPVEKLFTNQFVDAFNDFDKDGLRAEAKQWK
jgi:NitT/TauT family transport system substrate-binding protein